METFKLEVYAYPINNNDWKKRHSFYFDALNLKEFGDKRGASALLILLMTVHPYTSTPHILDMYLNKIIY